MTFVFRSSGVKTISCALFVIPVCQWTSQWELGFPHCVVALDFLHSDPGIQRQGLQVQVSLFMIWSQKSHRFFSTIFCWLPVSTSSSQIQEERYWIPPHHEGVARFLEEHMAWELPLWPLLEKTICYGLFVGKNDVKIIKHNLMVL